MKTYTIIGLSFALVGCTKMAIDGEVVNARGEPLEGARVATIGSPCMAEVEATGKFELTCPPGSYVVVLSAEGYTSEEIDIEATERKRYDIGKHVLVKIPEQKGLFLFVEDTYQPMKPGQLERRLDRSGGLTHRSVCLDRENSEPNELSAGVHALFDYEHVGWRPFRLDDEGCAYRDTKNKQHKWTVEYREKAEYETQQVNEGKTIARLTLEPGDYFIANWKGFFVPVDDRENKHHYSGYWLTVR